MSLKGFTTTLIDSYWSYHIVDLGIVSYSYTGVSINSHMYETP